MSDNGRKASVVYEGNGSQTIFLFPFDYLRKAFIYAQDIKSDNVKDLVQGVDFEMDNNRHIHLNTALKAGHLLRIFRKTTTQPLVDWQDASVLRSADLTLQEVQLLHLAEETSDKVVDSAGLSVDPINTNLWNANFKRIGNVLDPVEPQDVVTLNYIQANKDGMINQIKATGQNEIQDITNTSNHVLTNIKDTGNSYIKTQTSLKDTTNTYANTALTYKNQAGTYKDIAQKWAESNGSPDNVADDVSDTGRTKSSRSWAMAAKTLYTQIKSKMEQLSSTLQQALSTLSDVKAQQSQIKTEMVDVKAAKNEAITQANKSKEYATEALNSANAAKQSAKEAKTFEPNELFNALYPIGIIITTATDNTPKPGEEYGLAQWEEIGKDRVLQGCSTGAGNTIEAGLPNITGTAAGAMWGFVNTERSDGAFRNTGKEGLNNSNNGEYVEALGWDLNKEGMRRCSAFFDASKSNSIYGKSSTVQPSALKVHFWKRIN